jgi:HD-GYP domain-containing protein (c-di-GMP phosphodiesterase class II)
MSELVKFAGRQFDPRVSETFLGLLATRNVKL